MRIQQICTTLNKPCGIGNFARSFHIALGRRVHIQTTDTFEQLENVDAVVIQHEWGIVNEGEMCRFLQSTKSPVFIFGHNPDIGRFSPNVTGFLCMAEGIVGTKDKPTFTLLHPAFSPRKLLNRTILKKRLGLNPSKILIGSSGFLMDHRQFPLMVSYLLPSAWKNGWVIHISTSDHAITSKDTRTALEHLAQSHPSEFVFRNSYISNQELNARLQASDILWCWTNLPSRSYASGVISDMYASGTRIVTSNKNQHAHVTSLPNVAIGPDTAADFALFLEDQVTTQNFSRHDPSIVDWNNHVPGIVTFLRTCIGKAMHSKTRNRRKCGAV